MRLAVWSPNALIADALGVLFGREADVEVVVSIGSADLESLSATLSNTDLLVVHAAPLDDCRRLFARLDFDTRSSLVAIYLASSPHTFLSSRARLFGFAEVIDSSLTTDTVLTTMRTIAGSGPSIGAATTWTFESPSPAMPLLCPHCRDERDVEILQFIVDGHTDSRIAELMNLNAQTIRNRVSNMLLESGMSNRTQLAIDFYRAMLSARGVDTSSDR
jgi:DNA-binding NarL/FixJ family response regulator